MNSQIVVVELPCARDNLTTTTTTTADEMMTMVERRMVVTGGARLDISTPLSVKSIAKS